MSTVQAERRRSAAPGLRGGAAALAALIVALSACSGGGGHDEEGVPTNVSRDFTFSEGWRFTVSAGLGSTALDTTEDPCGDPLPPKEKAHAIAVRVENLLDRDTPNFSVFVSLSPERGVFGGFIEPGDVRLEGRFGCTESRPLDGLGPGDSVTVEGVVVQSTPPTVVYVDLGVGPGVPHYPSGDALRVRAG